MFSRSPRALFSCLLRTEINTIFTRTLAKTPEDVLPIPGLAEKGEQVQQLLAEDEPKAEEANQQRSTGMGQGEEEPIRKRYQYSMNKLDELNYDVWPYRIERDWWKRGKRTTFWASWRQAQDVLRRELLAEVGPDRLRWKAMKTNNILPRAIIDEFQDKMNKMPRVAHPRCCLNMCQFTGARRGKLNRFRLNKHLFRELADYGKLSGVQRGIW